MFQLPLAGPWALSPSAARIQMAEHPSKTTSGTIKPVLQLRTHIVSRIDKNYLYLTGAAKDRVVWNYFTVFFTRHKSFLLIVNVIMHGQRASSHLAFKFNSMTLPKRQSKIRSDGWDLFYKIKLNLVIW